LLAASLSTNVILFRHAARQHGASAAQVKQWQPSLLRQCADSKAPVICAQPRTDPHFVDDIDGVREGLRVRGTVFVPLATHTGAVIGVLQVLQA
jgi:hypothetical protein